MIFMRTVVVLLILITLSTASQACWFPENAVDNFTSEIESVKAAEPAEETSDNTDGENITEETETTTEGVLEQDIVSHPVETEPVMLISMGAIIPEQRETSNVTAVSTGDNKGSYVSAGIILVLILLIIVPIYHIRK